MRWKRRADEESIAQEKAPPTYIETADKLQRMVEAVSADEFSWQEAHYDRDSWQGRELLFLMANHEWVRATSEIVGITRSDAVETTIKVDVDLDQVTHEAFRGRKGPIWLPVAVLPPTENIRTAPDLFATVTDATGKPVPMLPVADLRHQASAAMAEIIVKMAISHWPAPGPSQPPVDTRDERLLLSAAIYRLLRDGSGDSGDTGAGHAMESPRIPKARDALRGLLGIYNRQLEIRFGAAAQAAETARGHQFTPELARRAAKILQALTESIFIVVQADFDLAPSVLTIQVPNRKLTVSKSRWLRPSTWVIRPAGHLEIDVLLPTADADRQIQVSLPDGVSVDDSVDHPDRKAGKNDKRPPWLDIEVHAPLPLQDLGASVKQVISAQEKARKSIDLAPVVQPLLDLARAKAELALDTLRHYEDRYRDAGAARQPANGDGPVRGPRQRLEAFVEYLGGQDDEAPPSLEETWGRFDLEKVPLSRRLVLDQVSPQTAVVRANMIENVSQRATPKQAKVHVDVTVDDRDYFSTARSSAFMSLILMCGVLCLQVFWPVVNPNAQQPAPEVLAIVITLFATIQANRIERPDRSTLRGQLFAMGSWLIGASVLPSLTLALAFGFETRGVAADLWAGGCILAQFLFLVVMKRGPLTPTGRPRLLKRRVFTTKGPDYRHFEALRSDYWRNTTADALMIGRTAYGYVVWQKVGPQKETTQNSEAERISPMLRTTLLWDKGQPPSAPSNVLALLRTGTQHQAVTFVVFRDKWPADEDRADAGNDTETFERRKLDLDPERLAPADSVASTVDVFVGVSRDKILKIAEHPAAIILDAAANKLVVLDTQLPVPAPALAYRDRQWARVRVALRDADDIQRLADFLTDICGKVAEALDESHIVAVQTVPKAPLRPIYGPAILGSDHDSEAVSEIPVLTTDLDIVNGYTIEGESPAARTWRVLAICGDARSNIESDIVQHLAAVREDFQLAGLTYALLHGTAVMVLLVHEPVADQRGARAGQAARPDQDLAAALEADLRKEPGCAKLRVLLCKSLTRDDLEPAAADPYPMLRVRFNWQDRPGAILNVLESIGLALIEERPAIAKKDWSVAYARVQVLVGQLGFGRLTIRVHVPPQRVQDWNESKMAEMARTIEMTAANEAASPGAPGSAVGPVISIDRIKLTGSLTASKGPGTAQACPHALTTGTTAVKQRATPSAGAAIGSVPVMKVVVYSHDADARAQIKLAIGRRPAIDVPDAEIIEVATEPALFRLLDAGGADVMVLDGEAQPAGGMGVCRQAKDEIYNCPPVLLLIGRADDRWLATWSRADAVISHPIDPVALARELARLMRGQSADAKQP